MGEREVDSGGGGGTFISMAGFLQSPGCRSCLLLYAVKWAAFSHLPPFSSPSQELSHNLNSEDCSRSGGSGGEEEEEEKEGKKEATRWNEGGTRVCLMTSQLLPCSNRTPSPLCNHLHGRGKRHLDSIFSKFTQIYSAF